MVSTPDFMLQGACTAEGHILPTILKKVITTHHLPFTICSSAT